MSGRLVPASTMTPCVVAKPSISTSSWFSVFSRSSLPPAKPPRPRARPIASISSAATKALFCPCPKSQTLAASTYLVFTRSSASENHMQAALASADDSVICTLNCCKHSWMP